MKKGIFIYIVFLVTVCISFISYKSWQNENINKTFYAVDTVYLREEPTVYSKIIGVLSYGDKLKLETYTDEWSNVKYNDKIGYVPSDFISNRKLPDKMEVPVVSTRKLDSSKPMVALTFDDGPKPESTPRILETLEKYNCVATFFDVGSRMSQYPEITQREEAIGCEVGSHTYSHSQLSITGKNYILKEIQLSEDIYRKTLGHNFTLVRTPYGEKNNTIILNINYPMIYWDIDTRDWENKNKDAILEKINQAGNLNGKIILMHSSYPTTADAVDELIPNLLEQGYQLVTISELAKYKNVKLETHTFYSIFQ